MKLLRLLTILELGRLRSARGRIWLDVLAIFGFAFATVTLLGLTAAIHMFTRRVDNPPETVTSWFDSPADLTNFMENYAVAAILAFVLMLLPALALVSSSASMVARSRGDTLRQLRLIGMSRTRAASITLIEVGFQAIIGMVFGSILFFSALPLWELLSFHDQPVSASEIVLPLGAWLTVYQVILFVTLPSAVLSLSNLKLVRRLAVDRGPERLVSLRGTFLGLILLGLISVLVYHMEGLHSALEVTVLVVIIGVFFIIIGPLLVVGLGYIERLSKNPVCLLAGSHHISSPRETWNAVAPVSVLMLAAIVFSAGTSSFSTETISPTAEFVFRHDLFIGFNVTIIAALFVGAVATALSQGASILNRQAEAESLLVMGIPIRVVHRARLMETVAPLVVMMLIGLTSGVILSWADLPSITWGWDIIFGVIFVFGFAVFLSVVLNRLLHPLQLSVLREDARSHIQVT
ncbi:MAG: hypothetical protein Q4P71_06170 [Actinomycetaceae bacterium]|nr:hypothetical protein [Actinomycetaceae bacterium]